MRQFPNVLILFILLAGTLTAQKNNLYVKSITRDNGLASNRINCIFEDKTGFIWFGTQDGLNRFAGYGIETFRHDPQDTNSIVDNRITAIIGEPATGNLWIGTENGLSYFDISKHTFKQYFKNSHDTIFGLCYDLQGKLWIGTTNGLYTYQNKIFSKYEKIVGDSNSIKSNRVYAVASDRNGTIWVGTNKGLEYFDVENDRFIAHTKTTNLKHIRSILCSSKNDLWIGTYRNGLFHMSKDGFEKELRNYTKENGYLLNNRVQATIEDSDSTIYIADRDGGLIFYDFKNDRCKMYISDIHNENSLNSKALRTILKSTTGIIWIGTYNSGVNYIDNKRKPFEHYKINFKENGLFNNNIRSMFQDSDGAIWIGTKEGGGLSKFNRELGTFKHFKFDPLKNGSLKDDYVFAINELDENNLLIGTYRKGLAVFNKPTEKFKHYLVDSKIEGAISSNCVYALHKETDGKIWIGTFAIAGSNGDVNIFDPKTGKFSQIDVQQVRCFLEEDNNKLWLGTLNKGLVLFNQNTKRLQYFMHNPNDPFSISSNNITSLKKDSKGNFWVATDGGGLNLFDIKTQRARIYNVKTGLPNNRIFAIQIDNNDNVWLSTAEGISQLIVNENKVRNFDILDGLQGNEFESYVSLKTREGEMLFGGRNGFNIFNPDSILDNMVLPKVVITGFKLFYKPVEIGVENSPLKKAITQTKYLELTNKQSVITFEFIALNYSTPEKNQYAYILEGFDEDWNYIGNNRNATYTNLPHGKYVFRVKASNNDGYWNNEGTSINIEIKPPWYKTWTFRIVLIVFLLAVGFSFYQVRIYQYKKNQKILTEQVKERTKDLQIANKDLREKQDEILNQKEELEITLEKLRATQSQLIQSEKMASVGTLISGIAHEINNPLNYIQGGKTIIDLYIQEHLKGHSMEFKSPLAMIDEGLQRAAGIVQSLNHFNRNSDEQKEICNISFIIDNCLVMLQNSLKHKISLIKNYTTDPYILKGNEGELHQVFLNLLTNATQAISGKGEIKIQTHTENKNLFIVISDNGKGIEEKYLKRITDPFFTTKNPGEGTGLGLSIAYSIIKQHKGSLTFISEPDKGTTATVKLPF